MRPFSPRVSTERFSFAAWLYATPHSPNAKNPKRKDTLKRPFKLIPGGVRPPPLFEPRSSSHCPQVHHWDENGRLDGDVPPVIRAVHEDEVNFVQAWMKEWREKGRWKPE